MIHKNQDVHRIKFLEEEILSPEWKEQKLQQETQSVKKKDNVPDVKNDRTILNAGMGSIKNTGGPQMQMGSKTNNSIWNSDILDKLAGRPSNKEKTLEKKENINRLKNSLKEGRIDDMVQSLQDTDTRKDTGVYNIGTYSERGGKYKMPSRHMSIFNADSEFSRVPQKTAGEKITEEANMPKEKDDSWKNIKGTKKVNNALDNFFDHITKLNNE